MLQRLHCGYYCNYQVCVLFCTDNLPGNSSLNPTPTCLPPLAFPQAVTVTPKQHRIILCNDCIDSKPEHLLTHQDCNKVTDPKPMSNSYLHLHTCITRHATANIHSLSCCVVCVSDCYYTCTVVQLCTCTCTCS